MKALLRSLLVVAGVGGLLYASGPLPFIRSQDCTQVATAGGLQAAVDAALPGDVICLEAGDYSGEGEIGIAVSGADGQPVTLIGLGDVTLYALSLAEGVSYWRFQDVTVQGYEVWGVTVAGGNQALEFSGLTVTGGEAGFHFTHSGQAVDSITLADSVVRDVMYTAIDCTPGPCNNMRFQRLEVSGAGLGEGDYGADALAVEKGASILVEDCYFHDNSGDGIDLNSRDAGPMPGIVVRRNRVINPMQNGIKLWNGGEVVNNLVVNAHTALVTEPGDYLIAHNTFANNSEYDYLAVLGGFEVTGPSAIRLYNNIFYNDNPAMGGTLIYMAAGVQLEADHNLYYNPYREEDLICWARADEDLCASKDTLADGAWFAQTGQDEHSLYADPLFVDAAGGDFHLSADSPAVDAGMSGDMMPTGDLDGAPRPVGAAPDLGAYERP